jgi:hypothetical protein
MNCPITLVNIQLVTSAEFAVTEEVILFVAKTVLAS